MTVGRVCVRDVDLADPLESVQVAADRMSARHVRTLVVNDAQGLPIGILTDRDLAIRVVAQGLDPHLTTVGQVMTAAPQTVRDDSPIATAISLMFSGPYSRLPVVDATGKLVGLLRLHDVLDLLSEAFRTIDEDAENGKSSPNHLDSSDDADTED